MAWKFNTYFWAVLIPSIQLKCHTDYLATNQYADVSCNFNLLLVCIVFPFTWVCFIVQRWAKTSWSSWCLGVTKVGWDKMLTFVYITNTMFFWELYSHALAAIFSNLFLIVIMSFLLEFVKNNFELLMYWSMAIKL